MISNANQTNIQVAFNASHLKPRTRTRTRTATTRVPLPSSFNRCFKVIKRGCLFDTAERLFHNLEPLKEKHCYPFLVVFFGSLKSVLVFSRHCVMHREFILNRFYMYYGASPLSDSKTIGSDSLSMSCLVFE